MQTKTSGWTPIKEINVKEPRKLHFVPDNPSFLYIGKDRELELYLAQLFKEGFIAKDFNQATEIIKFIAEKNVIDIIFIDINFDREQLSKFADFFRHINGANTIPVIYNECKVRSHCNELRQFQFIDDVIQLDMSHLYLFDRIAFLKVAKVTHHKNPNKKNKLALVEGFHNKTRYISKRILDLTIASFALVLLLPLLVCIALLIRLDSRGPVIYTSKRAGKGYKVFEFYKFRTMEVNADKKIDALAHLNQYDVANSGPRFFKLSNDPRITRIGKFLRNTSLDELPQLINVIKGDMSLVGNRPLPLYEAATLTTNDYIERFMAPSGITGLWQIMKRGNPMMSTQERVELDIRYARKFNIFYDFWIMVKTPAALFQKTSA